MKMITISFDRTNYAQYKKLRDEALSNKQTFFIWKHSLVKIGRANQLIEKFDKAFAEPLAGETVTIPYVN